MSEGNLCIGSCDPGGSGAIAFLFKGYPRTISAEDTPTVAGEIDRALQYWPERAELFARKKDHGRAEAALLARYAAERICNGGGAL